MDPIEAGSILGIRQRLRVDASALVPGHTEIFAPELAELGLFALSKAR